MVLAWSSEALRTLSASERVDMPTGTAFDACGNVVLFEPAQDQLVHLKEEFKAPIPKTASEARSLCRDGRAVIAYFPSGGVTGGMFGHLWHMVTEMHPADLEEGHIRVAGILYPTRRPIVSALAARRSMNTGTALDRGASEQHVRHLWERLQSQGPRKRGTAPGGGGGAAVE